MTTKNIIFSIGSKMGPGGFASMKAAIDMLGQMYGIVKDNIEGLDQFQTMWEQTNQKAVMSADAAAKGLIDTTEVLRGYNSMVKRGVELTDEQFSTLAKRAVDLGQAIGERPTEAFKKLTHSIAIGSTRALREFGIKVNETNDMAEMQANIVKKLTEGYSDLEVEAKNTTDRLFQLSNNVGTFNSLLWTTIEGSETANDAFAAINDTFAQMIEALRDGYGPIQVLENGLWEVNKSTVEFGISLINLVEGPLVKFVETTNFLFGKRMAKIVSAGFADLRTSLTSELAIIDSMLNDFDPNKNRERRQKRESDAKVALGKMPRSLAGGPKKARQQRIAGSSSVGGDYRELSQRNLSAELSDEDLLMSQTIGDGGAEFGGLDFDETSEAQQQYLDSMSELAGNVGNMTPEQIDLAERAIELQRMRMEMDLENTAYREEMSMVRELEQEQSVNFAQEWGDAWSSAFGNVSAGSLAARSSMMMLHSAVTSGLQAAILGQKSFGQAVRETVAQQGASVAAEAGFQAMLQVAYALADAALPGGIGAAAASRHMLAAGQFAATAVVAGAASGIAASGLNRSTESTSISQNAMSSGSGGSTYNPGYASPSSNEPQEVRVSIAMKEDGTSSMFDVIYEENERASMDGRPSWKAA